MAMQWWYVSCTLCGNEFDVQTAVGDAHPDLPTHRSSADRPALCSASRQPATQMRTRV
ncbi:MAG: hypothetical protein NTZ05_03305 [Chloroflexi bacterium]|nr:hypothetical protein [Chloroflexota bacterium]